MAACIALSFAMTQSVSASIGAKSTHRKRNMIDENWVDIENYGGRYQVSNLGRVKSVERDVVWFGNIPRRRPEMIMALSVHNRGYLQVLLRLEGVCKKHFIHRLVALHFIPNPEQLPLVNHRDRDKKNNTQSNLEWVTHQQNSDHWVADDAAHSDIPF